jgi:predicted nucleic-acid-binding protein
MLGVDTNVLVRFLVHDDEAQFQRALNFIRRGVKGRGIFISELVLLETEWVLRSRYKLKKPQLLETFSNLLDARELMLENEHVIEEALFHWRDSAAQFADCLIAAHHRASGCEATATFDGAALKVPGFIAV